MCNLKSSWARAGRPSLWILERSMWMVREEAAGVWDGEWVIVKKELACVRRVRKMAKCA
jgi:hypothetical protein